MFRLQVKTHFDAAHKIANYQGKCNRLHGHRWDVELVLEGAELDHRNILVDFGVLKRTLKDYLDNSYDHYYLNDILDEPNITAEYLAKRIFDDMTHLIFDSQSVRLARVTVWESPECCVKYYGDKG